MTTKYSNLNHSEKENEKSLHTGMQTNQQPIGSIDQEPDTIFQCGCTDIPASTEDVFCGCVETDVNAFHKDLSEREIQLDREKRIEELEQIIHDEIEGED